MKKYIRKPFSLKQGIWKNPVYSIMWVQNVAGMARFNCIFPRDDAEGRVQCIEVVCNMMGNIVVKLYGYNIVLREHYADQSAFATAYGLQQG